MEINVEDGNDADLTHFSKIVHGPTREHVSGAYFPQQPPPRAMGSKPKVFLVITHVLVHEAPWPVCKLRIVNLQELLRHRGGSRHHKVDKPQPKVHERAILMGQGRNSLVWRTAHVRQVSHYGPWAWPWWQW